MKSNDYMNSRLSSSFHRFQQYRMRRCSDIEGNTNPVEDIVHSILNFKIDREDGGRVIQLWC